MDVRAQTLASATQLFAARGYEATSLQQIADAVGVSKATVLYHFPSKTELRRGVLDELVRRWNELLPKLLLATATARGRFDGVMRETLGFFAQDPDRARLLMREVLDRPEEMASRLAQHASPWIAVVAEQIRLGQSKGTIHADVDAEAYVLQVITLIIGGVATAASLQGALSASGDGDADPLERHVRELHRVARRSLFTDTDER